MSELLSPRLLAKLEQLQLATRRPMVGGLIGAHRSPRFGASLDFSDYRPYHPGDDIRRLDINAYARLDRLTLKLFEAENDLVVRLLIDTSASMEGPKLQRAKEIAAAVGFVALTNRDVVTLHSFPETTPGPRILGRNGVPSLFKRLNGLVPSGDTQLTEAVIRLLAVSTGPSITVVVSDLLTPEWESALRRIPANRGELVVVQVLEPNDVRPELSGDLQLVDKETGAVIDISATPEANAEYEAMVDAWVELVGRQVRRVGASYLQLLTTDDLETVVLGSLLRAGSLQ